MPERNALAPRPTTYKGIAMRSRLEARYAAWLDHVGADWTYEPQCFATEDRQYLPDFKFDVMFAGAKRTAYVEVKPIWDFTPRNPVLLEMGQTIWATDPDALFIIEIRECDHPLVYLPPSWGVNDSIDCHWLADTTMPTLGFLADQTWREEY